MTQAVRQSQDAAQETMAYAVELWPGGAAAAAQVLAQATSVTLGYACYYAALQAHPDAMIVLRSGGSVLSSTRMVSPERPRR